MGCDIHIFVEKQDPETKQWFMTKDEIRGASGRDYYFFALLAGVRANPGEGPDPKGFPNDTSLGVKDVDECWGGDAHSHSWYSLDEFIEIMKNRRYEDETLKIHIADLKIRQSNLNRLETKRLNEYTEYASDKAEFAHIWRHPDTYVRSDDNYRVLFFFDN